MKDRNWFVRMFLRLEAWFTRYRYGAWHYPGTWDLRYRGSWGLYACKDFVRLEFGRLLTVWLGWRGMYRGSRRIVWEFWKPHYQARRSWWYPALKVGVEFGSWLRFVPNVFRWLSVQINLIPEFKAWFFGSAAEPYSGWHANVGVVGLTVWHVPQFIQRIFKDMAERKLEERYNSLPEDGMVSLVGDSNSFDA